MTGSRTKGKIANSEWPSIVRRHLDGESIASIARSYNCTAPAIRYIVRRSAAVSGDIAGLAVDQKADRHTARNIEAIPSPKRQASLDTLTEEPRSDRTSRTRADAAPYDEPVAQRHRSGSASAQQTLSRELLHRANSAIAAFLVALDSAYTKIDAQALEELRDATDRLLHACARTRLELERVAPLVTQTRAWESTKIRRP
ncbi:MAG TPA: hypothetical protein VNS33_12745 [Bradyrhizobium sp.]|nr:hypothetical protein [Bradyrhizobium sp.]